MKKKPLAKIKPVKKAACPECKVIMMKASEVGMKQTISFEWYCPKCNKIY